MISTKFQPFVPDLIPIILKSHPDDVLHLKSRENSRIEFKESFNFGSKDDYGKTMAAFANASGGYLIFGVTNKPRVVCGLQNENFDDFDPEKLTSFLNSAFSPELEWESQTITFHGKTIGMFYTWESSRKPIVCIKNSGPLKEADIYYRYRGRSERIKYPELANLLETEREHERRLWRQHLENISKIGVSNAAVLDTKSGLVSGSGGSFLISEELLPKLKFVREGAFHETIGDPTLKLVGDLKSVDGTLIAPTEIVVRHQSLQAPDVIVSFLKQEKVDNPLDYIRTICFSTSAYLPVHFFMALAGLSVEEAVRWIAAIPSRQATRGKLIDRLRRGDKANVGSIELDTTSSVLRKKYLQLLRSGEVATEVPLDELPHFFQAVTHLKKGEFPEGPLLDCIAAMFGKHYATAEGKITDLMRRAVCHLDDILFGW